MKAWASLAETALALPIPKGRFNKDSLFANILKGFKAAAKITSRSSKEMLTLEKEEAEEKKKKKEKKKRGVF